MPTKAVFSKAQFEVLYEAAAKGRKKYKNQTDFALALDITQPAASALLAKKWRPGVTTARHIAAAVGQRLEDLVGEFEQAPEGSKATKNGAAFPNLDICVQFHSGRKAWAPWTIAAAKAGFFGPTDYAPPEWSGKLDHLEEALKKVQKSLG